MAQMPMPAEAGAPQPQQEQGGATKLVSDIHDGLMQLMDLMSKSDQVDDSDKQALGQVISQFQAVVEGLGSAPGQQPQATGPKGPVSPEAGASGAQPAM